MAEREASGILKRDCQQRQLVERILAPHFYDEETKQGLAKVISEYAFGFNLGLLLPAFDPRIPLQQPLGDRWSLPDEEEEYKDVMKSNEAYELVLDQQQHDFVVDRTSIFDETETELSYHPGADSKLIENAVQNWFTDVLAASNGYNKMTKNGSKSAVKFKTRLSSDLVSVHA